MSLDRLCAELRAAFPGERLVFGEGNGANPALMLIGEAPGAQEALQGRPFVGKAGQNLNEFLELAGLKREDLFITNTVKLRPCETGEAGRVHNRAPNKEEIAAFLPFLLREIAEVKPGILVTLGNTPLRALTNETAISRCHGQLTDSVCGVKVYALYHPASLIYRPQLKEVYRQDVLALRSRCGL